MAALSVAGPAREFPGTAVVLTLAGGIFIALIGGLIATSFAALGSAASSLPSVWGTLLGAGGIVTGIALAACGVGLWIRPRRYAMWGGLIVLFAIVSLIVAAGGLFVGFLLAIGGGVLTLSWTPSWERKEPRAPAPPPIP
ncbi:MAG: DUF6114 domain-containing protein [Thermoplasmata archaeon]